MNLIRFETNLDFHEDTKLATPARLVFQALSGQKHIPKERRPREPGARIRGEKEKVVIVWNTESCSIMHEDRPGEDCIPSTITYLEGINQVAPIGKLSSRSLRLLWILPVAEYDFRTLEAKYRGQFIKQSEIFENCSDSTVVIDMKCDNYTLHHQSGVMGISQLQKDFRTFKMKDERPGLFVFLEATINGGEIEYSSEEMRRFLLWSFEQSKSHSVSFEKIMEAIL